MPALAASFRRVIGGIMGPCPPSPAVARRTGCPVDVDRYEWRCGFYPGIEPNRQRNDTARLRGRSRWLRSRLARDPADADRPRIPAVKRPPRLHYAMWDAGMKMPTQFPQRAVAMLLWRCSDDRRQIMSIQRMPRWPNEICLDAHLSDARPLC
jgi:hypothetical protein